MPGPNDSTERTSGVRSSFSNCKLLAHDSDFRFGDRLGDCRHDADDLAALVCAKAVQFVSFWLLGFVERPDAKLSRRACSFRAAQSGAARAAPWMVAATAQTNSNRSSPDGVMLDILVHPFMFGIVPHYLKCVYYTTSPRKGVA